jgi:predicted ATPase
MITRLEIDGFKSFEGFSLDLEPFTVLAGPNNSGKSNLLEAVILLRDLQRTGDVGVLVRRHRGTGVELFHRADDGAPRSEFKIGAALRAAGAEDLWRLDTVVTRSPDRRDLQLRVSTFENPSRIARRRDAMVSLDSWISINPHAPVMRNGASLNDSGPLAVDGANLAAVVGRIHESGGLYEYVLDAAFVIGDLQGVTPIKDERRNLWDFDLVMRGGRTYTPSLVSDGTLRVLALLAAVHDPEYRGTVLVEEIENGLHPQYIERLCGCVTERLSERGGQQVIATTHSQIVVSDMIERSPDSVVFLDQVFGPADFDGTRRAAHWTRARRVGSEGERGTFVPSAEVRQYLAPAESAAAAGQ